MKLIKDGLERIAKHKEYTANHSLVIWYDMDDALKFTKADKLIQEVVDDESKNIIDVIIVLREIRIRFYNNVVFKQWVQTIPDYKLLLSAGAVYVLAKEEAEQNKWYQRYINEPCWLEVQRASV